ncbi:Hpt domain-containing protein [Pseudomonas syringae]|nr:Hpt domain-containing protein [Pseudomonas syringae]MBD8792241.1 Hpt domain-containing protein [Pseudomonas syringae]MBD8803624.1 Hpt domain-containing protein [Pseudomonas syringae]MBD8814372.1 Hpt domain-containing protein [Pseudomonas syringae]
MPDRHDYVALEWVKGEIAETLSQARQALEVFVAAAGNLAALDEYIHGVHQVQGSLQMIEFYGAALLAEEIELLGVALREGRVGSQAETVHLLNQAMTQLPLYLERTHAARRDLPLVILPLLNDLRGARGESLLSETRLFAPQFYDIDPLDAQTLSLRDSPELPGQLRQWRQNLQSALAGLMREQDVQSHLQQLAEVFGHLEHLCADAPLGALWRITSALVESLPPARFTNSPALRSLLRDADRELKRLTVQGIEGINQPVPEELLKSLLFYIAKSDGRAPRLLALKDDYALDDALPGSEVVDQERARMAGPGRDAMRSVILAVCAGLVRAKERLDVFVRGDRQHVSELNALLGPLRQIADTLAVLGFGQPRKVIIDQTGVVQSMAQGQREPNDAALMDVAGALLYVESTLAGMIGAVGETRREESRLPTTDLTQIHQLVVREARLVLQQAKDVLIDSLEDTWSPQRLEPLCELLVQVRGALAMIPLGRAAGLLAAAIDCVRQDLLGAATRPGEGALDGLAEALSAIEYYLERMNEDHEAAGDQILDMAQSSLARLGHAPPAPGTEAPDDDALDEPVPAAGNRAQVLASPLATINPPGRDMPASLLPPPAGEPAVDDELRQVFIEEANEILAGLQQSQPRWLVALATPGAATHQALREVRRAFHSLKGSGRMVRALVLSELAWSVENLLNRVLEGSVPADQPVRQLLSEVQALLPSLIADFANAAQRQRDDADRLATQAHRLAGASAPAAPTVKPAHDLDSQLLDIFRQEALGHLHVIDRFLDSAARRDSTAIGDDLLRALHTLKGSAYMAGVLPMAELASPLDELVRELKANLIAIETPELKLLRAAEPLFYQGLEQLDSQPLAPIPGAAQLIETARSLLEQRLAAALQDAPDGLPVRHNPKLIATFLAEGMDIVLDAESLLQRWRQHPGARQELTALLDELTTLGHSAHLAELPQVDELCEALLDLYGAVEESSLAASERFFDEAGHAHEALIDMLDQIAAGQDVVPRPDCVQALYALLDQALAPDATGLVARDGSSVAELGAVIEQLTDRSLQDEAAHDDEIITVFLEEAADILDSAGQALHRWLSEPENPLPLSALQRDLHTLKGGARMAGITAISDLGHELEALYEGLIDRRYSYSPALAGLLLDCHDQLQQWLEQLGTQQPLDDPAALIGVLEALRQGQGMPLSDSPPTAPVQTPEAGERDPELLEIFLEEGFDILDSASAALSRWQADPHNTLEVENLLRDLHTLKGGARMLEIKPLSDLAHEVESLYESVASGVRVPGPVLMEVLQRGHDRLADMLDAVRAGQPLPDAAAVIDSLRQLEVAEPAAPVTPLPSAVVADPDAERIGPEMVKVAAEDLEQLVNLAGETSIFRGRIEQQIFDTQATLAEIETTLARMRDQLRRLDSETQGRLLVREQAPAERRGYEEFDPLEMDRHSELQQLSRALSESASDLLDLKETLDLRARDAGTLLTRQARVNTELQEGLMRTRMVPFERLVPRLRRVVRQVAGELDKQVQFEVANADGELDRSVLERMVAPLEHMLRNAVDHGLESTERRLAAGKPAQGLIQLALMHEGGDLIIELSDDGPGVDLAAVRRKAIKRGLIRADAVLADHEVLPFILEAGFSTAEVITQISGRGVGMDVVHAEVKQLGGSMTIDSVAGLGTRFRIRLPFSVSVNRALMVQCGEELYAVPLNTIEGIVRVMPSQLLEHYQARPSCYRYGGRSYELRYLGELLGNGQPRLFDQFQPLPVLLVHLQDQWVAVQVDALAGSREIVVKSLGAQFAQVQGLSGATILGDGRVVLILDLPAYVRTWQGRAPQALARDAASWLHETGPRALRVMVVDDSVTVRKVTGRLLERHGMQVVTAKDGVDAMALLEDYTPDILLLDIEMPRMDGFEVATRIRQDERLKDLPIIMITSRSGHKHRDRATAIGVNDYLSKPYQESVLIDSIKRWSARHV